MESMNDLAITSGIASAGPAGGFYSLVAFAALCIAVGVAIKAWFHDRAKGRSRCRLCAYPLPHDRLDPCPECGWKPKKPRDLYRTRQSKRWLCVSLVVAMFAGSVWYWPHVQYRRSELGEPLVRGLVPTTYMIWAVPHTDQNEWLMLCHRVSGNPNANNLFVQPQTYLPGAGIPITTFEPDPIHLGYKGYNYQNNTMIDPLFGQSLVMPDAAVWHWQGQYLLGRLIATANDEGRALAQRLDAFYLYTVYCGYERLEHVERVLPLLQGKHQDVFREANSGVPHWGIDALDPNVVVEELKEICLNNRSDLIYEINGIWGLAMTGNPALEVIEALWASDDVRIRERGTELMEVFAECVSDARGKDTGLDRDHIDVDKIIALIDQAISRKELSIDLYNVRTWVSFYSSTSSYVSYSRATSTNRSERKEIPVGTDHFFARFSKAFMVWIAHRSNAEYADIEMLNDLLISYSGRDCLASNYKESESVLDAYDQLLDSNHREISEHGIELYSRLVWDVIYESEQDRFSETDLQSLQKRLKSIMNRTEAESDIHYEARSLLNELEALNSEDKKQ